MQIKGMMTTCDRCGATWFSKRLEDGVTDGGYTKYEQYQDTPPGWTRKDFKDLCDKCSAEYERMINEFYGKGDDKCG